VSAADRQFLRASLMREARLKVAREATDFGVHRPSVGAAFRWMWARLRLRRGQP